MIERHVIAQMKRFVTLIKLYIKHFYQKSIFIAKKLLFFPLQAVFCQFSRKKRRNHFIAKKCVLECVSLLDMANLRWFVTDSMGHFFLLFCVKVVSLTLIATNSCFVMMTRESTRMTCWHHVTHEVVLKSWKNIRGRGVTIVKKNIPKCLILAIFITL